MNRNQTAKILMQDEEVLYTLKPNLAKMVITTLLGLIFVFLFFGGFFLFTMWMEKLEPPEEFTRMLRLFRLLFFGGIALIFFLVIIFQTLAHRNRFYTVTNKRFIIQKGLFGIDYSSIPLHAVQYISVNVSLVDQMLRRGTGSITFGTTSTPVHASQGAKFVFANIYDVYENYRKFKELVDKNAVTETE
ncbi:MAG: PH domain-containing protein [Bacilli bacterium]|jgi:uncharacterized membrane protein YdbT with pleckstrin-like domain